MTDITVVIVAKNDTLHLFETIRSVKNWVFEIIIVDIGIPKYIKDTLSKQNIRIIMHTGNVAFADQIRDSIVSNIKSKYVLFLDPDEILPIKLQKYIQENYSKYDSLAIPRKNFIFGKWIQHSRWWPDYQLRLYDIRKGKWPPTIHSKPQVIGTIHNVPIEENLALIHYNYENIDHYFEKMQRYTKSEARNYLNSQKKLTMKAAFSLGVQEFISRYFSGKGYKDGMHGFVLSFFQSIYYPIVYFYYWEMSKFENKNEKEISDSFVNFYKELFLQSMHWSFVKTPTSLFSKIKFKIISFLSKS